MTDHVGSKRPRGPKRTPFHQTRRLTYQERPGFKRRVFNDVDDRIARAEQAGYRIVYSGERLESDDKTGTDTQMGTVVSRHVGINTRGENMRGVLMEIPEELYEADQKEKLKRVADTERELYTHARQKGLTGKMSIGDRDE